MLLMRTLGRVPQIEDQWDYASNTSSLNGIANCQPQICSLRNRISSLKVQRCLENPTLMPSRFIILSFFNRSTMCLNWFFKPSKPRHTCWPTVDYGEYKMNSTKFNLVSARQVVADSENLHPMKRREAPMVGNGDGWQNVEHDNDHVDHMDRQCPLVVGPVVNANCQFLPILFTLCHIIFGFNPTGPIVPPSVTTSCGGDWWVRVRFAWRYNFCKSSVYTQEDVQRGWIKQ